MQDIKKQNIWLLIIGLLAIASGLWVLFSPITALVTSALILGIVFIVMGVGYLMVFRNTDDYMMLVLGILDILLGLIFLINLGVTAITMPIIFALWCVFVGISQLVAAFQVREMPDSPWGVLLLSGILGILFGALIFFYPVVGTFTITVFMGGYLILYGVFELLRAIRVVR